MFSKTDWAAPLFFIKTQKKMAKNTGIQWTDATWNTWHGCQKVSEGCKFCYMYRDKER